MWALATIKPNAERSVSRALERREIEFHVFRYKSRVVRRGRVVTVLRPLFPRYVFVPMALAWLVRHQVDGVLGIVCFGSDVAAVPPEVVDRLVALGVGDVLPVDDAVAVEFPDYLRGDRVVAVVGVLVGRIGVVVRRLPSGKVRCEFDLVGKRVLADLPAVELRLVQRVVAKRRRRRYSVRPEETAA